MSFRFPDPSWLLAAEITDRILDDLIEYILYITKFKWKLFSSNHATMSSNKTLWDALIAFLRLL